MDKLWGLLEERHARALLESGDSRPPIRFDDALKRFYWPYVARLPQLSAILGQASRKKEEATESKDAPESQRSKRTASQGRAKASVNRQKKQKGIVSDDDVDSGDSDSDEDESEAVSTDEDSDVELSGLGSDSDGPKTKTKRKSMAPPRGKKRKALSENDEDVAQEEGPKSASKDARTKASNPVVQKGKERGGEGSNLSLAKETVEPEELQTVADTSEPPPKKRGRPAKKGAVPSASPTVAATERASPEQPSKSMEPVDLALAPPPASEQPPRQSSQQPTEDEGDVDMPDAGLPEAQGLAAPSGPNGAEDELEQENSLPENSKPELSHLASLGLEEVKNMYGDRLRLIADSDSRWQALTAGVDHAVNLPPTTYQILQAVASARAKGMSQVQISHQFSIDPRSMYHHVKTLQAAKVVIRFPAVVKGQYTNMLVHISFASLNPDYHAFLAKVPEGATGEMSGLKGKRMETEQKKKAITDMLKNKKNGIMIVEDMHVELGFPNIDRVKRKWFNHVIDGLAKEGYVEKAEIVFEETGRKGRRKCVKLLKEYVTEMDREAAAAKLVKKEAAVPDRVLGEGGILADLPLAYQMYRLAGISGGDGVTSTDLRRSLHNVEVRVAVKTLEPIIRPDKAPKSQQGLSKGAEFAGREKRFRMHADVSWQKEMESWSGGSKPPPRLNGLVVTEEPKLDSAPPPECAPVASLASAVASALTPLSGSNEPIAFPVTQHIASADVAEARSQSPAALPSPPRKLVISPADRVERLARLLEKHHVLEIALSTCKLFQQLEDEELGTTNPYVLDKRTLARMADTLEGEKRLRKITITVPTYTGSYNVRTIVVLPDMDRKNQEVRDFIEQIHSRAFVKDTSSARIRSMERSRLEAGLVIERADGTQEVVPKAIRSRRERKDTTVDDSMDVDEDVAEPGTPLAVTDLPVVAPAKRIMRRQVESWQQVSADYGFVPGKMARARLVHEFLFNHVVTSAGGGSIAGEVPGNASQYPDQGTFRTSIFISEVPVDVYLKVIGQTVRVPSLDEYVADPENAKKPLKDMPAEIRQAILSHQRLDKFRRELRQIFDVLLALGIVEAVKSSSEEPTSGGTHKKAIDTHYRLMRNVDLRNYTSVAQDVVKSYVFARMADVQEYWKQLYVTSTTRPPRVNAKRKVARATGAEESGVETAIAQVDAASGSDDGDDKLVKPRGRGIRTHLPDDHPLAEIYDNKIWDASSVTPLMRKVLNRYVNRTECYTPLEDDALLDEIAAEIGLKVEWIREFYRGIEATFKRRPKQAASKKADKVSHETVGPNRLGRTASPSVQTAAPASLPLPDTSSLTPSKASVPVEQIKPARLAGVKPVRNEQKDRKGRTTAEKKQPRDPNRLQTRQRIAWTHGEDETLMHAYVIVAFVNGSESRVPWTAVESLVSDKPRDACRRRVTALRKNPIRDLQMQSWIIGWPAMFDKAVADGVLDAQLGVPPGDKDLQPWLEYFKQHSGEIPIHDPEVTDLIYLPENYAAVDRLFDISFLGDNATGITAIEEQPGGSRTLRSKLTTLYNIPFTINLEGEAKKNVLGTVASDHTTQLLRATIKMITITPPENYNPDAAHEVIQSYGDAMLTQATESLKEQGMIVNRREQDKGAQDRQFLFSGRFWRTLAGSLPLDFVRDSTDYATALARTTLARFDPLSNHGTVACVLDLMASRDVVLGVPKVDMRLLANVVKDPSEYQNCQVASFRPFGVTDCHFSADQLEVSVRLVNKPTPGPTHSNMARPVRTDIQEARSPKDLAAAAILRQRLPPNKRVATQSVYHQIAGAGPDGIRYRFLVAMSQFPESEVASALAVLKATTVSEGSTVPLVALVGFESMVYVSHEHFARWNVDITRLQEQSGENDQTRVLAPPRLWYDITGSVVPNALRACRETVVSTIMSRPGISFVGRLTRGRIIGSMLTLHFSSRSYAGGFRTF